jgi:hypothetical protein
VTSQRPGEDPSKSDENAPPKPPVSIFMSDASAEAERVAQSLRAAGYVVVDVPLSMLVARVAVQRPRVILIDADADGALEVADHLNDLPESEGIDVLFVGRSSTMRGKTGAEESHARGGSGFFERPIDAASVLKVLATLTGGAGVPAPAASGSIRPPIPSLPPPSMRSPPPRASLSRPPPAIPRLAPLPSIGALVAGAESTASKSRPWLPDADSRPRIESRPPGDAYRRHASSQAPLSNELEQLLAEAEQRIGGNVVSESIFPSPDEEIAAVLPPEVLASLDEPLEDEDEDDPLDGQKNVTTSGGRQVTTGNEPRGQRIVSDPPPPLKTHSGTLGGGQTTGARGGSTEYSRMGSSPAAPNRARDRESDSPQNASPSDVPSAERAMRTIAPSVPHFGSDPPEPISLSPRTIGEAELKVPLSLGPAHAMRGGSSDDRDSPRRESDSSGRVQVANAPNVVPSVLGPGDAARALAYAITTRATGSLSFETTDGVRRAVLREGDLVTAGSGFDGESLLAFLGQRGDLPREQLEKLQGRVPAFGRHAGAALVAYGHLRQDQLWPVLRSHAEWVLARAIRISSGTARLEAEPPGRLRSEPSVFGGATGAEVFVEIVRRTIAPDDAALRLGGTAARIGDGPNAALLAECALDTQLAERLANSRGTSLAELFASSPEPDVLSVVFALTLLGVFEIIRAIGEDRSARPVERDSPSSSPDALDEDAIRDRVRARMQLVEEADYFSLLGVSRDATGYEVRRAFIELRRAFEPSRILTPEIADLGVEIGKIVTVLDEAYEVLRDTARRERYRRAISGTYK